MNTHANKTQEKNNQLEANAVSQNKNGAEPTFQFVSEGSEAITQRKRQDIANNKSQLKQVFQLFAMDKNHLKQQHNIQKKENNIGLPAQLQAQENYSTHEAGQVIQQKQVSVKPTVQLMGIYQFGRKKKGSRKSNKGKSKLTKRDVLLKLAVHPDLKTTIEMLYREGATIGDGGTADVIRHELKTGEKLSETGHVKKGKEMVNRLNRLIQSSFNESDMKIANDLLNDLTDALKGVK